MNRFFKFGILVVLLALPGSALATHLTDCRLTADCSGWNLAIDVDWRSSPVMVTEAHVRYKVVLYDVSGPTEVDRITWEGNITRGSDPETFEFNGLWGQELCGDYKVRSYVNLDTSYPDDMPQYCEGTVTFTCECGGCTYTPGYWKNHPENWPVDSLALGCSDAMTQAQLLGILNTPVRGDATIILAYHLIAAKLNVLYEGSDSIQGAIDEADALLCSYPLRSSPQGDARDMILDVKNMLAAYNELECGESGYAKDLPDEASSSWSELKANYR